MPLMTRTDLEALMRPEAAPCVSLYMPCSPEGMDFRKGPIRFKGLLQEAEQALASHGSSAATIERILSPGRRLVDDPSFWQRQGLGFAYLADPGQARHHRLPHRTEQFAWVGERYYLKPLLPLLAPDGRFWLLALEQERVRLFAATREAIREIDLHDIPTNLRQAVGYDFSQRSLQFHTRAAREGAGRRAAMFFGHGDAGDDRKEELESFFRLVDAGLNRLIGDRSAPMVLAGVEYERAIFRRVSKYPNVLEAGIDGSPKPLDERTLLERARPIVEPVLAAERTAAAERFERMAGTPLATADLQQVLPAAQDGRVETLFVATDVTRWGRYDSEERTIEIHERPQAGDEDLLEVAALRTLTQGGTVHALPQAEIPCGGEIAALLRY